MCTDGNLAVAVNISKRGRKDKQTYGLPKKDRCSGVRIRSSRVIFSLIGIILRFIIELSIKLGSCEWVCIKIKRVRTLCI